MSCSVQNVRHSDAYFCFTPSLGIETVLKDSLNSSSETENVDSYIFNKKINRQLCKYEFTSFFERKYLIPVVLNPKACFS